MQDITNPVMHDAIPAQDDARPFHIRAMELKKRTLKKARNIALDCGLTESTVSRYLSGASIPSDDVARKIMQYLRANIVQSPANIVQDANFAPEKIPTPQKMQEDPEDMRVALETLKTVYEARISDLWKTIDNTEKTHAKAMDAAEKQADRAAASARRDKLALFALVCVLLGVLIFVLLDASNPSWGVFMPRG